MLTFHRSAIWWSQEELYQLFHLLVIVIFLNTKILDLLVKFDFLVSSACNRMIIENVNSICRHHRSNVFFGCLWTYCLSSRLLSGIDVDWKFLCFTIFTKQRIDEGQVWLIIVSRMYDWILSIEAHLYHPKHIRWNVVNESKEIWILCCEVLTWTLYSKWTIST